MNSLKSRQDAEMMTIKKQGSFPLKGLLTQHPFNYDSEIADEICADLIDGMELCLNAGVSTVENDVDTINKLGGQLSSLTNDAVLYCVIDNDAEELDLSTLNLRDRKEPLSMYTSEDINAPWPSEANFCLTKMVKVASYVDFKTALACFLNEVSTPYTNWSSWVANIVVVGNRDGAGVKLRDCSGEVLDASFVFDSVDEFKRRTAKPGDLSTGKRGPYAARVALSHNVAGRGQSIEFGFKSYPDHSTEEIFHNYHYPNAVLVHPDDECYKNPNANETANLEVAQMNPVVNGTVN